MSPSISSFSLLSCHQAALSSSDFLSPSEQTETDGEVENGGWGRGEVAKPTVCPSIRPVVRASVHHMLPALGSARTKQLQEGRKAPQDNLDSVVGLGLAKNIYGPNPSLLWS